MPRLYAQPVQEVSRTVPPLDWLTLLNFSFRHLFVRIVALLQQHSGSIWTLRAPKYAGELVPALQTTVHFLISLGQPCVSCLDVPPGTGGSMACLLLAWWRSCMAQIQQLPPSWPCTASLLTSACHPIKPLLLWLLAHPLARMLVTAWVGLSRRRSPVLLASLLTFPAVLTASSFYGKGEDD